MIPHALAMVVLGQIDRIMIVKYCGDDQAGIYSFGYSYAIILSVVTNAIMNAWQPFLYDCLNRKKYIDIIESNKILNKLGMFMTICFITIAPETLMILGSKDFWNAKYMVAPVAIGTLFQFFYSYFVYIEMYKKKTCLVAIGSVSAAVINTILNFIFIPKYGYIAAAYTTMIGYAILMIYHWISYRVIFKQSIFMEGQIIFCSIMTTVVGLFDIYLYDFITLRYLLLVVFVICFLLKNYMYLKDFIKNFVKK